MKTLAVKTIAALSLVSVLFFFIPTPYVFASGIAYDTSGTNYCYPATTCSVSLVAAASNELAVICVGWGTGHTFSGITVGGSSTGITQIGSTYTSHDGSFDLAVYYLANPPISSSAYQVSFNNTSDDEYLGVQLYSGAKQTGQPDSYNTGYALTSALTISTTVVANNSWLVSCARQRGTSGTPAITSGGTTRQSNSAAAYGDSNGAVGTGSQSVTWTKTSATEIDSFIASIAPTAAPTSKFNFWQFFDF